VHVTFIANPHAGRGRTKRFFGRFLEQSPTRLDAEVRWSQGPGHATEIARSAAPATDVFVIVGGDGTVHEVVAGLMPTPKPIVVLPAGSGNDFAAHFACPTTPEALARVLDDGVGVVVDVIDANGHCCVNSIGLGFEAQVTKESRAIQGLRGLPLYLTAVFRAMMRFDCPPLTIRLDEQDPIIGERLMVSIGNGTRAGGGFLLTPDAWLDDGSIDLCIVERMGRLRMLQLLPKAIKGAHVDQRGVTMRRAAALTVESARPFHWHIDGEYVGETTGPLRVRILDRRLPVLCAQNPAPRTTQALRRII